MVIFSKHKPELLSPVEQVKKWQADKAKYAAKNAASVQKHVDRAIDKIAKSMDNHYHSAQLQVKDNAINTKFLQELVSEKVYTIMKSEGWIVKHTITNWGNSLQFSWAPINHVHQLTND